MKLLGCVKLGLVLFLANWTYADNDDITVDDWCTTSYKTVVQLTYKWAVNNFSIRAEKNGEGMESPTFASASPDGSRWYLSLYPRGHRDIHGDVISLFLCMRADSSQDSPKSVITQFKLSIDPSEGKLVTKDNEGRTFTQKQNCWGWYSFAEREEMFNKESKSILPFSFFRSREETKDILTVVANIRVMEEHSECVGGRTSTPPTPLATRKVTHAASNENCPFLNYLLQSGNWSDLSIYAGRERFQVHRTILASRSPHLWEALEEVVDGGLAILSGVSAEAMEQILSYVYTGQAPTENLQETLKAAQTFQMDDLVTLCLEALEDSLSKSNAIQYLVAAYKSGTNNSSFLKKAWDILDNNVEELVLTQDWSLLQENPELLSQLLLQKTKGCLSGP